MTKLTNEISDIFKCNPGDIQDLKPLKKGMNNTSFTFIINGAKYHLRTPGVGTDKFINRNEEYAVYQKISTLNLSEDIVYFDPISGYKIARFWDDARVCDPYSLEDVAACMKKLREFHDMNITVEHTFDPFERIEYFESLWSGPSCYGDYTQTKSKVMALQEYILSFSPVFSLAHIDPVSDNFLFIGNDQIRLIDWEYAAMQDPHIDIAMFVTYAMYDRVWVDRVIELYFQGCHHSLIGKIHAYIAAVGLCWSNWCEFKRQEGADFAEWALRQYQYAKDYA